MFSDTGKQNALLPGKSNKIMFSGTAKQNVLFSVESNKIMFWTMGSKTFGFLARATR